MNVLNFLNQKFLGNSIKDYLFFAGILIFGLVLKRLISGLASRLVYKLFKRHLMAVGIQKFLQLMTRPVEVLFTLLVILFAFNRLVFPEDWQLAEKDQLGLRMILSEFMNAAIILSFIWIILRAIDFIGLILIERAKKTESMNDDQLVIFIKESIKVIVAVIGFFVLLGIVFHLDVVSLVAGLGIGGLAIALAAKESLENLIGSFTIFLDKPFVTGDTVRVGNIEGKVEKVGFRSTRIRAVDKMIVTVPNKKMIDAELFNENDRMLRRSAFTLVLSYETTEDQLKKILTEIHLIINAHPLIENGTETVCFRNFGSTGLEILIIFIVLSPVINDFLDIQQEINFEIMTIVKKHNSSIALPSFFKDDYKESKAAGGMYKTLSPGK